MNSEEKIKLLLPNCATYTFYFQIQEQMLIWNYHSAAFAPKDTENIYRTRNQGIVVLETVCLLTSFQKHYSSKMLFISNTV